MIYGVNFNGVQIPDDIKRKFAARLNKAFKPVGANSGCEWLLVGVGTDDAAKDMMLEQANNGHRRLHVIAKGDLFGVYAG